MLVQKSTARNVQAAGHEPPGREQNQAARIKRCAMNYVTAPSGCHKDHESTFRMRALITSITRRNIIGKPVCMIDPVLRDAIQHDSGVS
jgi:hypothetical protein